MSENTNENINKLNVTLPDGNNWDDFIEALNNNFSKLANSYVYKGDCSTMSIQSISVFEEEATNYDYGDLTDEGKKIVDTIFEKRKDGDPEPSTAATPEKLSYFKDEGVKKGVKISWWCENDGGKAIFPAGPIIYIDPSFKNGEATTDTIDYTCMCIAKETEDDIADIAYSRSDIYPTFYYDPAAKNGRGAWCWKVNGVETGIVASAADETGVHSGKLFLLKEDEDENESPIWMYFVGDSSAGSWMTEAELEDSYKPLNNDIGYIVSEVEVPDLDNTNATDEPTKTITLSFAICTKTGASTVWTKMLDDDKIVKYDDAYMKYIFATICNSLGRVTREDHTDNPRHGFFVGEHLSMDAINDTDNSTVELNFYAEKSDDSYPQHATVNFENFDEIKVGDKKIATEEWTEEWTREYTYDKNTIDDKISNATNIIDITYSELKELRDTDELLPGKYYAITDYHTIVKQGIDILYISRSQLEPIIEDLDLIYSPEVRFDIIVRADSESTLSEDAWVRANDDSLSGINFSAWKIKYCLDNDDSRFEWVDSTDGKGIIYYMKDEWGNECPYDFKNILFARTMYDMQKIYHKFNSASTRYVFTFNTIYNPNSDPEAPWDQAYIADVSRNIYPNDNICLNNKIDRFVDSYYEDGELISLQKLNNGVISTYPVRTYSGLTKSRIAGIRCGINCSDWTVCSNICSNWSCGNNCSDWFCIGYDVESPLTPIQCSNWSCEDNCSNWINYNYSKENGFENYGDPIGDMNGVHLLPIKYTNTGTDRVNVYYLGIKFKYDEDIGDSEFTLTNPRVVWKLDKFNEH